MKRFSGFKLALCFSLFVISSCFSDKEVKPEKIHNNKTLQDYLIQGWNTWNNSNLLDHVLMPEGLSVKISFRKNYKASPPYFMSNAFISGKDNSSSGHVKPFLHYYDASYTDLTITWKGLNARIRTATDYDDLIILYTPEKITGHNHILILQAGILWGKQGLVKKMDNFIQTEIGNTVFSIRTTGSDLNIPLPLPSPYLTFESDQEVAFFTGKTRSLDQIKKLMNKRDARNRARLYKYGNHSEVYAAMHNVLNWNTIYDPFNHMLITPLDRELSEDWGGYHLNGNTSYFTSAMFALDNKWRAYSNAIAITGSITENGYLPGYTAAFKQHSVPYWSQPPAGSLICLMIYNKYKDKWFLREVFDKLLTWNRWWEKSRENRGYLSWGCEPVTGVEKEERKKAAINESGLFNSPIFNDVIFNPGTNKIELAPVDLLSLYIADCLSLAEIADILDKTFEKQELNARAEKFSLKLNDLWDEERGVYRDKDLISNNFIKHTSSACFLPLLTGVPSTEQAQRLINEHFFNENEFYGEYIIPYIALNDQDINDSININGNIYGYMNFLIYLGLKKYGLSDAGKILAEKSANMLLKGWIKDRCVYDSYNCFGGEGTDNSNENVLSTRGGILALLTLMEEGFW